MRGKYSCRMLFVSESVMKNPRLKGLTEKEVRNQIADWLRGSGDRKGGKKRRLMAKLAQDAQQQQTPVVDQQTQAHQGQSPAEGEKED